VKTIVQAGVVAAGAFGLVMAAGGAALAQIVPPNRSLLSAVAGADVGTLTNMVSVVACNNHLVDYNYKSPADHSPHPCINGPVHSGNSVNSGNFLNHGDPQNSGNFTNDNGSTNTHNAVTGPAQLTGSPGPSS
jgi:hypothetical protein